MLLSLEQIFNVIAKDKGLKNPAKWVEEKLNHCEVHSDYHSFVNLKSHKRMYFGVRDTKFDCQDFILYVEYMNNDEPRWYREFEIYTFKTLNFCDEVFNYFKNAFEYHYDTVKDFRLYFQTQPVLFSLVYPDKSRAKLGQYNDLGVLGDVELLTDLFKIEIEGNPIPPCYCKSEEQVRLKVIEYAGFFEPIKRMSSQEGYPIFYDTDKLKITFIGSPAYVLLWKDNHGYDCVLTEDDLAEKWGLGASYDVYNSYKEKQNNTG